MRGAPGLDLGDAAHALLALGRTGSHPAGAVVGVLVDGVEFVAAAGCALSSADSSRPMDVDTVLDLASVTKVASTTALAMWLVADGSLDLDERVATYLPHFASARGHGGGPAPSAQREAVTVRHLLEHTSGLPPWLPLYCRTTDRDEALVLAATTPLVTPPGAAWTYSDLGMIVLGAAIERVTGVRQDVAFARRVAEPLGLGRTTYGPVPAREAAAGADTDVLEHQMVATGEPYQTSDSVADFAGWRTTTVVGEASDGNAAHALGGVAGHAGLFTTIPELLALGRSLVDPEVVPDDVVRQFTTPQELAPDRGLGFGLTTVSLAGQRVPMAVHAGFTGTWLGVALDRDLVVAAAATRLHTTTGTLAAPRTGRADLVTTDEIAATTLERVGTAPHAAGHPFVATASTSDTGTHTGTHTSARATPPPARRTRTGAP